MSPKVAVAPGASEVTDGARAVNPPGAAVEVAFQMLRGRHAQLSNG
ncbi:MAG: hypothetical protein U0R65_07905 [Candidatus Nanopelagicales bacterium]